MNDWGREGSIDEQATVRHHLHRQWWSRRLHVDEVDIPSQPLDEGLAELKQIDRADLAREQRSEVHIRLGSRLSARL